LYARGAGVISFVDTDEFVAVGRNFFLGTIL